MSPNDNDLVERLHTLAEGFEMPIGVPDDDLSRGRRRVRRRRGLRAGAVAVTVAALLGVTAVIAGQNPAGTDGLEPVQRPQVVVGEGPVWYDAEGLHRGDVVEPTAIEIGELQQGVLTGALALVRSGAVYRDPATDDVWFHPWGGEPRIVGHGSEAGPGGDPNGDVAAWFEGSDAMNVGPGELVVYDTAGGREISRTAQSHGATFASGDHYPSGNTFLQVSADKVVWQAWADTFSFDVQTQETSVVGPYPPRFLVDLQDEVQVLGSRSRGPSVLLSSPAVGEVPYRQLETHLRLSPSGGYLLAVEGTERRHGAVIVDTGTGDLWRVPPGTYPEIAWSYGDIAMVAVEDALFACDAVQRACDPVPAQGPFLLPTN